DRATRPPSAEVPERLAHWGVGALLTLVTFAAAGRPRAQNGASATVLLGALIVLMTLVSPVCHLHYFSLSLPLVMGLFAAAWPSQNGTPRADRLRWEGLRLLLAVNVVANVLPRWPGLEPLRDVGMAAYAALLLWAAGCLVLWRSSRRPALPTGRDLP